MFWLAQSGVDAAKLLKSSFDKDRRMKFLLDPAVGEATGVLAPNEAKMLQQMLDSGRIDITITHDLGAVSSGSDQGILSRAATIASYPAQQLEVINRVSTALAGYRAEMAKTGDHLAAMKYADTLVADTHGGNNQCCVEMRGVRAPSPTAGGRPSRRSMLHRRSKAATR